MVIIVAARAAVEEYGAAYLLFRSLNRTKIYVLWRFEPTISTYARFIELSDAIVALWPSGRVPEPLCFQGDKISLFEGQNDLFFYNSTSSCISLLHNGIATVAVDRAGGAAGVVIQVGGPAVITENHSQYHMLAPFDAYYLFRCDNSTCGYLPDSRRLDETIYIYEYVLSGLETLNAGWYAVLGRNMSGPIGISVFAVSQAAVDPVHFNAVPIVSMGIALAAVWGIWGIFVCCCRRRK